MRKTNKQLKIISGLLIFIALALNINSSFAAIIKDEEGNSISWNDGKAKDAYCPSPILFIHGFASGGPLETWVERVNQKEDLKPNLDKKLERYFKYYTGYSKDPTILEKTRFPYLELISYIDFTQSKRSQLIDRNSSVDTYQKGDYYVKTKERLIGAPGWSDKLEKAIQELRENYKDKYGYPLKVILVCHSMGGLSAREYLTNSKYSYSLSEVEKLILIGVPNLGSPFAKLANGLTRAQRVGWFIPGGGWLFSSLIEGLDVLVEQKGQIDIDGDAVRDMDPTKRGSGFLNMLNNRIQPQNVDYFAIWGNGDSLSDTLVSRHLYQGEGDGVVSKDSQLGTGVLSLKDSLQIDASHGTEPLVIANDDAKPLLKFIDYTKPEVTITFPDPNASPITEVETLSINLKGSVSKEYLPADSILKIETQRQEDGEIQIAKEDKLLHPSDQWNPNDVNSARAEFDEVVTFSGNGTYKISCQVTNPAGLTSDIKEVWVKVTVPQEAGIIVHCHNPEGVEIASIQGMSQNSVEIYDGDTLVGHGAYNAETHNKTITISSGPHTIKAKFNGITKEQTLTLGPNETKILTFTFERTSYDIQNWINSFIISKTLERTWTGAYPVDNFVQDDFFSVQRVWHTETYYALGSAKAEIQFTGTYFKFSLSATEEDYPPPSPGLPPGGRWTKATSGSWNGYNRTPPQLPTNLPFNNWYINYRAKGNGIFIGFYLPAPASRQVAFKFYSPDPSLSIVERDVIPANLAPTESSAIFSNFVTEVSEVVAGYWAPSVSYTKEGTISDLTMSSVPYDLTGSGVQ